MSSFSVTAANTALKADNSGRAQAKFTVTNATTRAMRAQAAIKPLGSTKREWLSLTGEVERDLPGGGTDDFVVNFDGSSAPGGTYPFRLQVASSTNPDGDVSEGPIVNVEVAGKPTAPPPIKKKFPLWIIFVIAGVLLLVGIIVLVLVLRNRHSGDNSNASPTPAETPAGSPSPAQLINVALDKHTRESSIYQGGQGVPSGVPSHAVDGNRSGNWAENSITHTELERNAWWEVDLGSVQSIDHIAIFNRTDCCGERLSDFYVLVSETPFASNDLNENINRPGVGSFHAPTQAGSPTNLPIARRGRYVRIQLVGANYLSLAEVEVYAELGR